MNYGLLTIVYNLQNYLVIRKKTEASAKSPILELNVQIKSCNYLILLRT